MNICPRRRPERSRSQLTSESASNVVKLGFLSVFGASFLLDEPGKLAGHRGGGADEKNLVSASMDAFFFCFAH